MQTVRRHVSTSCSTSTTTPSSSTTWKRRSKYLIENQYYEPEPFDKYNFRSLRTCSKRAYAVKFRFPTFLVPSKFYTPPTRSRPSTVSAT